MNTIVKEFLKKIIPGPAQTFRNLSVVPLFLSEQGKEEYMTLSEGLRTGEVEVGEVNWGGSVNHVRIKNKSKKKIFVADGEEIAGAKQNRIVNTSLFLDGESETVVPASCTEQGRWNYLEGGEKFMDTGLIMANRARQYKAVRLQKNLQKNDKYDANQEGVWNDINDYFGKLNTDTKTKALKDAFDQNKDDLESFVKNCKPLPGQCGLATFINGDLLGFDVVSKEGAYQELHEKFIKSSAIEALTESTVNAPNLEKLKLDTYNFIESLTEATETEHKPVGLGIDYRFETPSATAAALVHLEVLHFSAHKKDSKSTALMEHKKSDEIVDNIKNGLDNVREEVTKSVVDFFKKELGKL